MAAVVAAHLVVVVAAEKGLHFNMKAVLYWLKRHGLWLLLLLISGGTTYYGYSFMAGLDEGLKKVDEHTSRRAGAMDLQFLPRASTQATWGRPD